MKDKILYFIMNILVSITPKFNNKIFMYDSQFIGFNEIALLKFMVLNNYLEKYKVVYFLHNPKLALKKYGEIKNVLFIGNVLVALWHRVTSKYVFCEQIKYVFTSKPKNGQIIMSLWHGLGLKNIGYLIENKEYNYPLNETFNYMSCCSDFTKEILMRCYHFTETQAVIVGNPRSDMLFEKKNCFNSLGIAFNYSKIILWLPTFRKSSSCNYYDSDSDFPLLNENNIKEFNCLLVKYNALMIIKPHPLQTDLALFKQNYSNIVFIKTSDFYNVDFEFYEFIGQVDALLSDYSSVYYEYLMLNRPIGFVIDDINSYDETRGFNVPNPLEMMPGHKIYNIEDLNQFIRDVVNEKDDYAAERQKINNLVNKYQDADNCKRLLEFLEIKF